MIEYHLEFSDEDAAKLAAKADEAGVVCDLDYLEMVILDFLYKDDSERLTHKE